MKKTLLLLASAALLLVGCTRELIEKTAGGDQQTVSFTVGLVSDASKAVADNDGKAANINHWIMQVLDSDGDVYNYQEEDGAVGEKTHTFNVPLIKGQTYQVLFWADTKGGYAVSDLRKVSRSAATTLRANADSLDAFSAVVKDFATTVATRQTITLKRPFAQLNVVFTDLNKLYTTMGNASEYVKFKPENFVVKAKVPTTFNVLTQGAGAPAEAALVMTADTTYLGNYNKHGDKETLYMDYILASAGSKDIVDIDFSFISKGVEIAHNFTSIPLQRNYRTNILGELMSAQASWYVEVDDVWDGEYEYPPFEAGSIEAANAALAAGETNISISNPSDYATIDLTIPAASNGKDLILDVADNAELALKVDAGTSSPKTISLSAGAATSLDINAPESHVELTAGNYSGTVTAITSATTLVVGKEVTVNTLKVTGGGVEIHGTVTTAEGFTDNVKVRECEGLGNDVYNAIKKYIDAPYYKAVQNGEKWDIVAADKTAVIGESVYYNLEDALKAAQSGDEIKLLVDLENIDRTSIPAGVTFNGCGHKITGNSSLYISSNGSVIKNVVFKDIHNNDGNMSAIYAEGLAARAEISGCTFENIDWDAIQIPTESANADIVIMNNVFKAVEKDNRQNRFIHIQSNSNVAFSVAVTGNKFEGNHNLKNCAIELYRPDDFNKVNISGNYLDGNKVSVCIANKENDAWTNHIDSAKNWLDANGRPAAINAAIRADEAAENVLLCTTLEVALQESAKWEGSLCILNETALRELSTLVNGGTSFEGKKVSLVNDIDLKNVPFTPIGSVDDKKAFNGLLFDGCNHTISNLKIEVGTTGAALFGYMMGNKNGVTRLPMLVNLTLKNVDIKSTKNAAAFVAYSPSDCGTIDNCHVDGGTIVSVPHTVQGGFDDGDKVGGIAGQLYGGHTISNCSVKNLSITAFRDLGGVIGHPNGKCTINGNVVENVTLIQSSKNAYKNEVTTIGEIAGRDPQYVEGQNTATNVTIITQPVEGYTFYKNEKRHEISSVAGLKYFSTQVNSGETYEGHTVQLMDNLDLAGETWIPAGNVVSYPSIGFFGTFEGQNHTIKNMTCSDDTQNHATAGFIGAGHCYIKDLTLENVNVSSTHYAAAFVGYASAGISLSNCTLKGGSIVSTPELINSEYDNGDKAGGLIGYSSDGCSVTNCTVDGVTVRAYRDLGGIAGAIGGTISGCTVKNSSIIQDNTNAYKESIDTFHEILGRDLGATLTGNTFENVTVKSE